MRSFIRKHQDLASWLLFTGLATLILLFISPDSYLGGMHPRVDSSWFFMCGKAWMNGLVPYVDFADSKGPLLWLIYGIGYLFSHTDYLGVFWISCFWYGLTFYFTFKTARIFLPETAKALLCTVMMSLSFFNPWFHNEIRAEDFSVLFMVISIYELCRLTWTECHDNLRRFFVLGCCFSALLLIKFNIAAMQAVLILAALTTTFQNKRFWANAGICAAGALAAALPFLACFLIQGNLHAFIQEYFLRTFETASISYVHSDSGLLRRIVFYLREWYCVLAEPQIGALLIMLVLGGILFSQQTTKWKPVILIVSLCVFALTIRHHILYYFTICSPFLLFLLVGLLRPVPRIKKSITALLSLLSVILCITVHLLLYNLKANESTANGSFQNMASVLTQVKKPFLINAYDHETGIGTQGEALPAGKYWARQNGSTPEMDAEHRALLLSGKADFIYVRHPEIMTQSGLTLEDLERAGYHVVCIGGEFENSLLLSNHPNLQRP